MYAAAIVAQAIKESETPLFTYPGGTIAPLYHECVRLGVPIIRGRTEQGAGYMAIAESQLGGAPTFVAVTSGPGVTNLVTCVADAFYDSVALVAITGQVGAADLERSSTLRQRGFQEVPVPELMASITKAVYQPKTLEELAAAMPEALHIATTGRPGPVVVDLPMSLQLLELESLPPFSIQEARVTPETTFNVDHLLEARHSSTRPLIVLGAGARAASPAVRELVESWAVPVASSVRGLGIVPTDHPLNVGWIGHTGLPWANWALQSSDFILALGTRLDIRQTGTMTESFAEKSLFHVDLDKEELEHGRLPSTHKIGTDVGGFAAALLRERAPLSERWQPWRDAIEDAKHRYPLQDHGDAAGIAPDELLRKVNAMTEDRPLIVTTGVGSHQQWAARYFSFDHPRRRLLSSAGHGTMGFGLPTAIGAKRAHPDRLVIAVDGDGSFQMNLQELALINELELNLKILVMDNQRLGIVSQFQQITFGDDPVTGQFPSPDFCAVAKAYGIEARRLESLDVETLEWWLRSEDATLLHAAIQQDAQVSPLLLGGQLPGEMWYQFPWEE